MPSHPKAADLPALLAALCDSGVELIIVGVVAGVLQGVPITTTDLDIAHRRTPENVTRLLGQHCQSASQPVLARTWISIVVGATLDPLARV